MTNFARPQLREGTVRVKKSCSDPTLTVRILQIDEASDGQRLDNFLLKVAKGVPKSHLYRIIRSGEVRVDGRRAKAETRLELGQSVRIPPIRVAKHLDDTPHARAFTERDIPAILFEDLDILIVDKPAGLAAHGGSGVAFGLIERLRASRPQAPFLELAHRLDRDTSGVIVVCKTRKALVRLQKIQRESEIEKHYTLLVQGDWVNDREHVKEPLTKYVLPSGERRVRVDHEKGLASHTIFTRLERFRQATLLDAELKTGRTHQIRVHAASRGFPLVGDSKYGDYNFNAAVATGLLGLPFKRMFLHASSIAFQHPITGEMLRISSELPKECLALLDALRSKKP